jgi:cob(I)alamin adenosyltransferase
MIQFIKDDKQWHYGELESAKKLEGLEIRPMGEGFTWDTKNPEKDRQKAREAWEAGKAAIVSGSYQMVILDELNYVMAYDYLPVDEVVAFLKSKPEEVHVVLTGRNAPPALIEAADLVTEMKQIKHPYYAGVKAQKGIEFYRVGAGFTPARSNEGGDQPLPYDNFIISPSPVLRRA